MFSFKYTYLSYCNSHNVFHHEKSMHVNVHKHILYLPTREIKTTGIELQSMQIFRVCSRKDKFACP